MRSMRLLGILLTVLGTTLIAYAGLVDFSDIPGDVLKAKRFAPVFGLDDNVIGAILIILGITMVITVDKRE